MMNGRTRHHFGRAPPLPVAPPTTIKQMMEPTLEKQILTTNQLDQYYQQRTYNNDNDRQQQQQQQQANGSSKLEATTVLTNSSKQSDQQATGMEWSFSWTDSTESQILRNYVVNFLNQPKDREYPDLCQLPDLTEQTLLENLRARFERSNIYTYVGSILVAVNPFKIFPIYQPNMVQLYQGGRLGEFPPHIFAIADASYQTMLRRRTNQTIVISGESGSGKTTNTNLLLHHLTSLSRKGAGYGVEQTLISAGPVLEAFGNAKTKHNNNSSRFGKFIQVNYRENGMVNGAIVQKYLLEKSRIVSQAKNERNYHVFYYMLAGSSQEVKEEFNLTLASDYFYLNQTDCYSIEDISEPFEFDRLKDSMLGVGFLPEKQHRLFGVLSAVLHLGNIEFIKKSTYHSDETVQVKDPSVVEIISKLLGIKKTTLLNALTYKRTKAAKGETIVINYRLPEAIATRDAMAKCLYAALFDWIVTRINQALLSKRQNRDFKGNHIGILDIFGFEDFGDQNYFEQFCINFANEHLHFYFNQHVFKYEQEEYRRENIAWKEIDFVDNTDCLRLIEGRPHGMLCLLDDQCNFPGATNQTTLQKFVNHHKGNHLFEIPPCRQSAFIIKHYAGKVKYQITDFREKNSDLMRPDIVGVLKSSDLTFVKELVGTCPLAMFRWQILRAFFKAYFIFSKLREASRARKNLCHQQEKGIKTSSMNFDNTFEPKQPTGRNKKSPMNYPQPSASTSTACTSATKPHKSPNDNNNYLRASAKYSEERKPQQRMSLESASSSIAHPSKDHNHHCLQQSSLLYKPTSVYTNSALLRGTTSTPSFACQLHGNDTYLCAHQAKVLLKASQIMQKRLNKEPSFKGRVEKSVSLLQTLKQLTGKSSNHAVGNRSGSKRTPTVTAQFQVSLNQLMDTLNQANPYFVRCIKSNAEKKPNHFDDVCVLLQLRYTGMLETVRIRQSGYSVRLLYNEFAQHYRILLGKGASIEEEDIRQFLMRLNFNPDNYQMGKTKVFMRETEKLALDEKLHKEILKRIVFLQRRVRAWIERRTYIQKRNAAIKIQSHVRRWLAQKRLDGIKKIKSDELVVNYAAMVIQKTWRGFYQRRKYSKLRATVIVLQTYIRAYFIHRRYLQLKQMKENCLELLDDTSINDTSINDTLISDTRSPNNVSSIEKVRPQRISQYAPRHNATPHRTSNTSINLKSHQIGSANDIGLPTLDDFPAPPPRTKLRGKLAVSASVDEVLTPSVASFKPPPSKMQAVSVSLSTPLKQSTSFDQPTNQTAQRSSRSYRYALSKKAPSQPPFSDRSATSTESSWNVTRTCEFTDPKDILITDVQELQSMDLFIFKKIYQMDEQKRISSKESTVDVVFKYALREFRANLLSTYSVATQDGHLYISYKNLIDHFGQVILNVCQKKKTWKSFPVIMGVNAFRGYLDEFRTISSKRKFSDKLSKDKKKENRFKRRVTKRQMKEVVEKEGHKMFMTIANIPTVCEVCTTIVKLGTKILVCNDCKLTCHKKCLTKVVVSCRDNSLIQQGKKVFGASLERLVLDDERVPAVLEQLMSAIEMKGLYVEGLYRKSATQSKINELKQRLEEDRVNVDLDSYGIHVLTAVFKSFFREMPEPLMTFQLYDDFLWATAIVDLQERCQVIFSHINKLSRVNYDLLERLTFHLARVALVEHANRMSASSLAIVFAPCVLRTDKVMQAQDSFDDIRKQTICLECIITERMKQVKETLVEIDILDCATQSAKAQLNSIRRSAVGIKAVRQAEQANMAKEEEARLTQQIENLQSEKSHLTNMLPSFRMASAGSDDDMIIAGDSVDIYVHSNDLLDRSEDPDQQVNSENLNEINNDLLGVSVI